MSLTQVVVIDGLFLKVTGIASGSLVSLETSRETCDIVPRAAHEVKQRARPDEGDRACEEAEMPVNMS